MRPDPGARFDYGPSRRFESFLRPAGRWNGGPGDSSDWYLTVGADGSYTLINDSLGWTDSGQVDATAGGSTMYNATGDRAVADAAGIGGCD